MGFESRKKNIYVPGSKDPFPLSRSKIDLFIGCPRCFYLDRRLGIGGIGGLEFNLNIAVDTLFKKEFDVYRAQGKPHPLMEQYGIDAIPFAHTDLDVWRENFKGIRFLHRSTNFIITGAVDDVWIAPDGTLFVVDYKSTSTRKPITLDGEYREGYKRQIEIYQWLLRRIGFRVSPIGYFVYANADDTLPEFGNRLQFSTQIISYEGDDTWVEQTVIAAHTCLNSDLIPNSSSSCKSCKHFVAVANVLAQHKK